MQFVPALAFGLLAQPVIAPPSEEEIKQEKEESKK
jgi:hypothetical protein